MELIVYGIINSVSLILMSIGFALAYGVSRVPNLPMAPSMSSQGI